MEVADPYGRPLNNIRLAVTDECNYRCIFCHMEGEPVEGPRRPGLGSPLLRPGDYENIAEAGSLIGVSKFKITGGEPLVRADIVEIVEALRRGAPRSEVSMTTNGYLLRGLAHRLREAGLARVNISIHSLRPSVYELITGVPGLERALEGLREAVSTGLGVKINMVVLRGVNDGEVLSMAEFARSLGATLQVIELHPVGLGARFFQKYHYPLRLLEERLASMGAKVERRSLHNRPIYTLPSGARIEIVRPVGNPFFCAGCTRIRIGPYGDLLPCINWRGPRPLITGILRSKNLSRVEKAARIAEELIDLVASRRPYYMCTLDNCERPISRPRPGRIRLAKRSRYEELKRELRRRLGLEEYPASTARGLQP